MGYTYLNQKQHDLKYEISFCAAKTTIKPASRFTTLENLKKEPTPDGVSACMLWQLWHKSLLNEDPCPAEGLRMGC